MTLMTLSIEPIPAFKDNYIWLLRDDASGETAVVDPGQSEPALAVLKRRGWRLDWILNTHHHWDHVSGNRALKRATGCRVAGAFIDQARIPGINLTLSGGDEFKLGESRAEILFTPGHTSGHICFWFPGEAALFCGDTLFLMGCGVLAEGDAQELYASLHKLAALPANTRAYCAHEYTVANGKFALSVDAGNDALQRRVARDADRRQRGVPTVPAAISEELMTNPFLRTDRPEIAEALGMTGAAAIDVFVALPRRKDDFRP